MTDMDTPTTMVDETVAKLQRFGWDDALANTAKARQGIVEGIVALARAATDRSTDDGWDDIYTEPVKALLEALTAIEATTARIGLHLDPDWQDFQRRAAAASPPVETQEAGQ